MEMYHDGSLFDILGETLPWQLIALTLSLRLLRPTEVARQPVKTETFSDQWHVRVYSHAAGSWSRSHPF